MAHVATCPICDVEFVPNEDAASGESTDCPSCGASFVLSNGERWTADPKSKPSAPDEHSAPIESLDAAQRRIDKWFNSAKTVADVPAVVEAEAFAEVASESKTLTPPENLNQTVDLPDSVSADDDIELDLSDAAAPDGPTWDDAERMERLLADIEVQPIDDYLPVARESHLPYVQTEVDESETVEYSPGDYERLGIERPQSVGNESVDDNAPENAAENDLAISPTLRPRRRRSALRGLVGLAVAGVFGLAGGYLILLWLKGPDVDFLNIARHLPNAILPASMREAPPRTAANSSNPADGSAAPNSPAVLADGGEVDSLPIPGEFTPPASNTPSMSAERQASFESPVTANSPNAPAVSGNRYDIPPAERTPANLLSTEPNQIEATTNIPTMSAAATLPKVSGAPAYSAEQFAAAFRAARDAQPGLLTGDLNDQAVQRTKGLSYSKLCDLAEIATFLDAGPSTSENGDERSAALETLFKETLAESRIRGEIARIAPIWINSAHRRHGGIFFAGAITNRTEMGAMTECQVDLGVGTPITIMAPTALVDRLSSAQSVAVLGSLIDKPAARIEGYRGSALQAVWVKSLIPLDR